MTTAERKTAIRRYAAGPSRLRAALHCVPQPALHWIDQNLASPLIRSQSPPENSTELEIPTNLLRAR